MAKPEDTAERGRRNAANEIPELRELEQAWHEDRQRRRIAAAAKGKAVASAVAESRDAFAVATAAPARVRQKSETRPARTRSWKGPHAGTKFRTAEGLRKATLEECAAGFEATWGRAPSPASLVAFRLTVRDGVAPIEAEARELYSAVRKAIDAVNEFAERVQGRTNGPAATALVHLWGELPSLPLVVDLPGYEKASAARRRLVETWQKYAERILGHRLQRRELAELSVLLGVGPAQPYESFFRGKRTAELEVSPADVLEQESKRLDRFADDD
jgi:hypothetical protein